MTATTGRLGLVIATLIIHHDMYLKLLGFFVTYIVVIVL